jgi:AcrR family transcriptional regulator
MAVAAEPKQGNARQLERRRRILRCATRLFSERGYTATTMDDIAAAADVTKRTLYRYVGDKEQLLFDIHDLFTSEMLVTDFDGVVDPRERFAKLVQRHVRIVADHRTDIRVFFAERKHLSSDRLREVEKRRDAYEAHAASVIDDLRDQRRSPASSSRVLAQAVLGSLTELYRWYDPKGAFDSARMSTVANEFFLRGLLQGNGPRLRDEKLKMPPRAEPAETPLEQIKAAASALFTANGFHATSMQEIAEAAEVTKGALFYHVRTKDELLMQILRSVLREGSDLFVSAAALGGTAEEVVARHVRFFMGFLASRRDPFAVVNENVRYVGRAGRIEIVGLQREWAGVLQGAIARGVADKEFGFEDVVVATRLVSGMLNSTYRWFRPDGAIDPDEIGRIFARLVLSGLIGPGA